MFNDSSSFSFVSVVLLTVVREPQWPMWVDNRVVNLGKKGGGGRRRRRQILKKK
jgi:hypothetical protein